MHCKTLFAVVSIYIRAAVGEQLAWFTKKSLHGDPNNGDNDLIKITKVSLLNSSDQPGWFC